MDSNSLNLFYRWLRSLHLLSLFLHNVISLSAVPSGTGVRGEPHPTLTSSPPSPSLSLCQPSDTLSHFNTSSHAKSSSSHPVPVLFLTHPSPPPPPPPFLGRSVGSQVTTAPLSFSRSSTAGSGHPSISTAANPSPTKPL